MDEVGLGAEPVEAPSVAFTFAAKFDGRCRNCGDETSAGQVIAKMNDDTYWCLGCTRGIGEAS
jgi:hypothetical protein